MVYECECSVQMAHSTYSRLGSAKSLNTLTSRLKCIKDSNDALLSLVKDISKGGMKDTYKA